MNEVAVNETAMVPQETVNAMVNKALSEIMPKLVSSLQSKVITDPRVQMAQFYAQSDLMPQQFRGKIGNCLYVMDIADNMGLTPGLIANQMDIIQGKVCWKSTAAIALVNNCGRFEPLQYEITHNDDWTEFSGYAYAVEKATGKVCKGTVIDNKMAKDMGWLDKNGTFWKKMPEQMLIYRTSVFFARVYCPEALMGLYTADEQKDISGKYEDSEPTQKFKL